jgi:hypothetical protein
MYICHRDALCRAAWHVSFLSASHSCPEKNHWPLTFLSPFAFRPRQRAKIEEIKLTSRLVPCRSSNLQSLTCQHTSLFNVSAILEIKYSNNATHHPYTLHVFIGPISTSHCIGCGGDAVKTGADSTRLCNVWIRVC